MLRLLLLVCFYFLHPAPTVAELDPETLPQKKTPVSLAEVWTPGPVMLCGNSEAKSKIFSELLLSKRDFDELAAQYEFTESELVYAIGLPSGLCVLSDSEFAASRAELIAARSVAPAKRKKKKRTPWEQAARIYFTGGLSMVVEGVPPEFRESQEDLLLAFGVVPLASMAGAIALGAAGAATPVLATTGALAASLYVVSCFQSACTYSVDRKKCDDDSGKKCKKELPNFDPDPKGDHIAVMRIPCFDPNGYGKPQVDISRTSLVSMRRARLDLCALVIQMGDRVCWADGHLDRRIDRSRPIEWKDLGAPKGRVDVTQCST